MTGGEAKSQMGESSEHPWLGLAAYRECDAGLFYGREREAAALHRLVHREPLTVVFGPSGTGKSSLLNAGLFPRLRDEQFLPIPIRIDHSWQVAHGLQIVSRITEALADRDIDAEPLNTPIGEGEESVWEYLHRLEFWDRRNRLITPVLVFDQFEEIFTMSQHRPEAKAFLDELADLIENYVPHHLQECLDKDGMHLPEGYQQRHFKIIVSLREDFVSRLDGLRKAMPSIMHNRFSLDRMDGGQALDAITKPGGHLVDEAVAREIVQFVADDHTHDRSDPDEDTSFKSLQIEPALLSLVCRELNNRRVSLREPKITSEQVKSSRDDILQDFYERSFDELDESVRTFVEDRLVTASGFRSTVALEDATESGLAPQALVHLVDRRLLRKEDRLGIPHLELTHDVLTSVVQKSRDARRERERLEKERLKQEAEDARRRKQLRRTRFLVLTIGSVALVFLYLMQKAEYQARVSFSHQLLSNAELKSSTKEHGTSILLRAAAYHYYELSKINKKVDADYYAAVTSAPYLWGTYHHGREVIGVTWSEETGQISSASASPEVDWAIEIWSWNPDDPTERGARSHVLQGHTDKVEEVVWSPDRSQLASSSWDENVIIWDATQGGNPLHILEHRNEEGNRAIVRAAAWNEEGTRLATASEDYNVRIWNTEDGTLIDTLTGHASIVTTVAWNSDDERLASADYDGKIFIWNAVAGGQPISVLESDTDPINSVAWLGVGNRVASASDDGKIRIWDVADTEEGQLRHTFEGHSDEVWSLSWSNAVGHLASADKAGEIRVWNCEADNYELERVLVGHEGVINAVRWGSTFTRLASVSEDKTLRIWNLNRLGDYVDTALEGQLEKLEWPVQSLSLIGERIRFTCGDTDGKIRLWNADNQLADSHLTLEGYATEVALAVANNRWSSLASTGLDEGDYGIRIWDGANGQLLTTLEGHTDSIAALAWNRSGEGLASASRDGTVRIWDPEQRASPRHVLIHDQVKEIAWNGTGTNLASLGGDGKIRIWDAKRGGEALRVLDAPVSVASLSLAWNPTDHRLATVIDEGKIYIWDAFEGNVPLHILSLRGENRIGPLLWNEQGSLLASGGRSGLVRVWDTDAEAIGDPHYTLKGDEKTIMHLAWNETGSRLASVESGNRMRIWKFDDESWRQSTKRIVNRNLTVAEWRTYIGENQPYPEVFPELPGPDGKTRAERGRPLNNARKIGKQP